VEFLAPLIYDSKEGTLAVGDNEKSDEARCKHLLLVKTPTAAGNIEYLILCPSALVGVISNEKSVVFGFVDLWQQGWYTCC